GGALAHRALERVARGLQGLARLVLGGHIVVDPDRAGARLRRVDRLADELAPEEATVLAPVLALGADRTALAHLLVPRRVALMVLGRDVDAARALADELARPVAEHLLEAPVAALVGAVAHERDADRRVVEDQLLLGERALQPLVRFALERHVLEAPDPFLDLVADIDAPAARAVAEVRAVAALEAPLRVVGLTGRGRHVGERAGAQPVVALGEDDLGALADELARPGAHHLLEEAVAALDRAVAHEGDADRRVVEDELLLGERALDLLLRLVLARDVLEQPHRALRRIARLHGAAADRAPDETAVLLHMLTAQLLRLAAPDRLVDALAARLELGIAPEHEARRLVEELPRLVAEDLLEATV